MLRGAFLRVKSCVRIDAVSSDTIRDARPHASEGHDPSDCGRDSRHRGADDPPAGKCIVKVKRLSLCTFGLASCLNRRGKRRECARSVVGTRFPLVAAHEIWLLVCARRSGT